MLPDANPLLILAVVSIVGLLTGKLARKLGLASVTGQILAGVVLGHSGIQLFDAADVHNLQPITEFALGITALAIGSHLQMRRLRNARRRLALVLLAEITVAPALVLTLAVLAGGLSFRLGILLAAMAISTAPATILAIISETKSAGVFVKTLVGVVALNNIACIVCFEVARIAVGSGNTAGEGLVAMDLLQPLGEILLAAALGIGIGFLLVLGLKKLVRTDQIATLSVLTVLLCSGLASTLEVSSMLACLVLGITLANLTPDKDEVVEAAYVNVRDAIFAVFFTLAGMHLELGRVVDTGFVIVAVVAARMIGKIVGSDAALLLAGATQRVRRNLGMALVPQAGVAVGLLLIASEDPALKDISSGLLAIGLTSVAINELIGPMLTRFALLRSGEAGLDRARLIDFLHEENIVTDLQAPTKEEAIEKLVDVLIRTNHLDADRQQVLASVLEREREMSTCFGRGLAIPHGILENGERMVGAMGLNRHGLHFDTPDGIPVYCMVVLVTPDNERDRHLQVLAALAQAIGSDRGIRLQLFHAQSAAHAYEILHVEETHDYNYFLDEEDGDSDDSEAGKA